MTSSSDDIINNLTKDIKKYKEEGDYFKMFKRMYNKGLIEDKINPELHDLINGEYGLFYRTINSLILVKLMLEQDFKPVSLDLILT
jgi:hypothetical protein